MYAQPMDTDNNRGIGLGRGEAGTGWRWGKGEKAETVMAQTITIKFKNESRGFKISRVHKKSYPLFQNSKYSHHFVLFGT